MRELGLLLGLSGGNRGNRTWGWESLWRQQHARAQELHRLATEAGHYVQGRKVCGGQCEHLHAHHDMKLCSGNCGV